MTETPTSILDEPWTWYDRAGNRIGRDEWFALRRSYRGNDDHRIGYTERGDFSVSTVWSGRNQAETADEPPLIFETLASTDDDERWLYSTEAQALAGHQAMCAQVFGEAVQ